MKTKLAFLFVLSVVVCLTAFQAPAFADPVPPPPDPDNNNINDNINNNDIRVIDRDRDRSDFDDLGDLFGFGGEADQDFDQDAESGDVTLDAFVVNSGDNSNFCAPISQFGNTGNLQNAQGALQFGSSADDIGFEGSTLEFSPALETDCNQSVQQSSAATSSDWWW